MAAAVAAFAALAPLDVERASAEVAPPLFYEGTISEPSDVDWFVVFALAGQSYTLSLERNTLTAGRVAIWRPAVDDSPARKLAQSSDGDAALVWTATESGAWRAQVSGLNGSTGSYRLSIRSHSDTIGADLSSARLSRFDDAGLLIERSFIDNPGDADWFAFSVASGNRYIIWSVVGSAPGLSAAIREPGNTGFRQLSSNGHVFSETIEPSADGMAVLEVRASTPMYAGSYAFGVTRIGQSIEADISLPTRQTSTLQIEEIEASGSVGEAAFLFRGSWGPISASSGLRVWIDVDPGVDEQDEWEYLLRSNDGRVARLWSFAESAWIDSGRVSARGFDTLVMRWSGRTAEERIRWQASVKNSDGVWTVSYPQLLDVPHPRPALPTLWPTNPRIGMEDPRWHEELTEAGVVADLEDDVLVVVLDPGHGVDSGAWANGVQEAASNLAFALRVEELLEERGVIVALTRRAAGRPYLNLDEAVWRHDLQVRTELAHRAGADLFVSIHSNASYQFANRGLEAWYLPRWNGDGANLRLSHTLLSKLQQALSEYGYFASALTYDATCWEVIDGFCDPIYVLAPFLLIDADAARRFGVEPSELGLSEDPWGEARNDWLWLSEFTFGEPPIDLIDPQTQSGPGRIVRANLMPTTLLELLYVTDDGDARILRDPEARELIAEAIADGILEFLGVE